MAREMIQQLRAFAILAEVGFGSQLPQEQLTIVCTPPPELMPLRQYINTRTPHGMRQVFTFLFINSYVKAWKERGSWDS